MYRSIKKKQQQQAGYACEPVYTLIIQVLASF